MQEKEDCLGNIPFTSVIGFILVLVGGGVLAGTSFKAIVMTAQAFEYFFFPVEEFDYVKYILLVASILVLILAIIVLVFAVVATYCMRRKVYRGDTVSFGGKKTAALLIVCIYIANLFWLVVLIALVIPNLFWIIMTKICSEECSGRWTEPGFNDAPSRRVDTFDKTEAVRNGLVEPPRSFTDGFPVSDLMKKKVMQEVFRDKYIFNLTSYGIYKKPWKYDKSLNIREAINDQSQMVEFCNKVSVMGPLYVCSLGGCIFILIGLSLLIGALASFYSKVRVSKELTQCKQRMCLVRDGQVPHSGF